MFFEWGCSLGKACSIMVILHCVLIATLEARVKLCLTHFHLQDSDVEGEARRVMMGQVDSNSAVIIKNLVKVSSDTKQCMGGVGGACGAQACDITFYTVRYILDLWMDSG